MIELKKQVVILMVFLINFNFMLSQSEANNKIKVHPRNIKLLKQGVLKKIPEYFPEIPRITATEALYLYNTRKALFLYIAYEDLNLIVGGIHLTEGQVNKINLNKLSLNKGQIIVTY